MPKIEVQVRDYYQVIDNRGQVIAKNTSKLLATMDAQHSKNNRFPWEVVHCIVEETMTERYVPDGRPT